MARRLVAIGALAVLGACTVPGGGTPPAARLTATPNPLVLEAVSGGPPVDGVVTVRNTGALPTGTLSVFGPKALLTGDTCTGTSLAPTEECELTFTYTPVGTTSSTQVNLTVLSPTTGASTSIQVQGTTEPAT